MGRITQCENVSLPWFLCWCWHLAWYQRPRTTYNAIIYRVLNYVIQTRFHTYILTVLPQTFFIAVWRSQTCFLLQYSICVPSYCLHYNYTGCCLLETTFLPLHLLHLSTPFPYPSPSPPPRPPITLSPRWPWGRPVWNVIGIIPFSLIASAGERSYVSPRMPTEPLRTHYTHISHRNFLKAESHTGMHALAGLLHITCAAVQGPCAVLCLLVLSDNYSLSPSNTCWWGSASSLH